MIQVGFLLIDKPVEISSHRVINILRRVTSISRIGHSGTLDPLATGLLIVGVGREATRELGKLQGLDKEYIATLQFGATSDTYDANGIITVAQSASPVSQEDIENSISKFVGTIDQMPPIYSAKKIQGRKAYELARKGKDVELKSCQVMIHEIEVLKYDWPQLELRVKCSSGTYIRSLAHDIGQALGCGAYLTALRRTQIGKWSIGEAVVLDSLSEDNWTQSLISIDKMVA
jgi:tRNA pseudouridine55 synthase